MNKTISFKTSGLSGDIIHYLAGIKQVCNENQMKADIYVWLNQPCILYEGAQHPYGNVMVNQYAFDMLKPLVESQVYVNSFQVWSGQEIQIDLDKRWEMKTMMPYGSLSRWIFYKFPDMTAPLHEPWLYLAGNVLFETDDILINRTSRYHNPFISYFFLERYKENLKFVGLEEEHKAFQDEWKFEIPHLKFDNFLDLACAIETCKFFIGNQSMCFAIAEAVKVPRILEVCQFAPNVIPSGLGAHDFISQEAFTYLVDRLNK